MRNSSRRTGIGYPGALRALLAGLVAAGGLAACSPSPAAAPRATSAAAAQIKADTVKVAAGWFVMGDDQGQPDARPAHRVYLDAFSIDRFEVSNAEYSACVAGGACPAPDRTSSETRQAYYGTATYASYPVIGVTYADSVAFCAWRNARLPTEAQWEKAARGTDQRTYPWGRTFDPSRLNYCDHNCGLPWADTAHDDGYADTSPVDSFPSGASPYGALNMAGNVWEWVADWYDAGYYAHTPANNPPGPATGTQRVTRGGGIFDDKVFNASTMRRRFSPDVSSTSVGFRCATTP